MRKLFYKSGEFCIFEDRSLKRMGRMTRPTILPVALAVLCVGTTGYNISDFTKLHPKYC